MEHVATQDTYMSIIYAVCNIIVSNNKFRVYFLELMTAGIYKVHVTDSSNRIYG